MSKLPAPAELVLYQGIRDILLAARTQVRQTVNTAMVQTYWQIGRLIVEGEQGGDKRAAYGKGVLTNLASRLTDEFGEGFRLSNLRNFRQFHECFSEHEIRHTVCSELAWSHLRLLMRVEDPIVRMWYANEAVTQGWSVRALDRQKHLRVEGEDCFVDLVFYNYLLKCFALIERKITASRHASTLHETRTVDLAERFIIIRPR